eukprot:324724_1
MLRLSQRGQLFDQPPKSSGWSGKTIAVLACLAIVIIIILSLYHYRATNMRARLMRADLTKRANELLKTYPDRYEYYHQTKLNLKRMKDDQLREWVENEEQNYE